jgi:glyoxylase-like metal-dependent hydrolase (beta-lactamase superfamily II)
MTPLQWHIGDVTITRIVETKFQVAWNPDSPFIPGADPHSLAQLPWLKPHFVDSAGTLRMSIHSLLVDTPGMRLIVDTCLGNDKPRKLTRGKAFAKPYLADLAAMGWTRESVDAVICTHLHSDHVGWNTMLSQGQWVPTFPNARYCVSRREYDYFVNEDPDEEHHQMFRDSLQPLVAAGLAAPVDPDHRLSAHVSLLPTPGHTPGHVSVLIESQGERAIITGDIFHHPCEISHPEWGRKFDYDAAASRRTRDRFLQQNADTPTLIIGTHFDAPTAGRIVRHGPTYRFDI